MTMTMTMTTMMKMMEQVSFPRSEGYIILYHAMKILTNQKTGKPLYI